MKQQEGQFLSFDLAQKRRLLLSGKKKDFVAGVRLAIRRVLTEMHADGHYDQVITMLKREALYRHLLNTWEELPLADRSRSWQELTDLLIRIAYLTRPYCIRCGKCCRQGSPSLHLEDLELFRRGILSTLQIYTLRQGEPVNLNIEGRLGTLSNELLKIKENHQAGHCIFYSELQQNCGIYDHRPLQCRMQQCWNPEALERLWTQEKLTRTHLLGDDEALLELVKVHAERCDPRKLDAAIKRLHKFGEEAALEDVVEMLRQDMAFRALLRDKLKHEDEELDFILGRPLTELMRIYGLRVEQAADGTFYLVADT